MKANGNKPGERIEPDLALVQMDFPDEFALQPEEAIAHLEALIRHRDSCLGRIAYVRALAKPGGRVGSPNGEHQLPADLAAEVELSASGGLWEALANGDLPPERIERLHRLTLEPVALWAAHLRFWERVSQEDLPACDRASGEPRPR